MVEGESAIAKFKQELKNVIYGIIYMLLKEDEQSIYISIIVSIIQFLQVLYFPFHKIMYKAWGNESVAEIIEKGLSFTMLVPYLSMSDNYNMFIFVLYGLIFLVAILFLDVFFVSYQIQKKKKNQVSWPLQILKFMFQFLTSVLFLPYLDLFFSVAACEDKPDGYYNIHFPEQKCFEGIHYLHSACGIITGIIFSYCCTMIILIYYECKNNSNDPTSKVTGVVNMYYLQFQTLLVVCFTFFTSEDIQYFLILLYIMGSLFVFYHFHFQNPFYNIKYGKMWSCMLAICVWTGVLLSLAKFLEGNLFEGTIFTWMVGIPLIILIIVQQKKDNYSVLLINAAKFQNGEQINKQIKYIQILIMQSEQNKSAQILLDGYLEVHRQTCDKDDCAARSADVDDIDDDVDKNKKRSLEDDKLKVLNGVIKQLFFYGIKKFPNYTQLRVQYALFLFQSKKFKQQALLEFSQAETHKPNFEEDFIIFRYKKIIEDEISDSQAENNNSVDIVSELAFQNHLRTVQNNIERSSLLHMEFWSQLGEENPDLGKLNEIGSKVNFSVQQVEEQWNRLKKIGSNMPKATRLYGKYVQEIINDRVLGDELMERARQIQAQNANNRKIQVFTSNEEISNEPLATVFITGEQQKFAQIVAMNQSASNLFSHQRTETINRRINVLMPDIYSQKHDQFLQNRVNKHSKSQFNVKERYVLGKNKSGYVFPIYLTIFPMQSLTQTLQYVGMIRIEKNFRKMCFLITDMEGQVEQISSTCINFLGFDKKYIEQNKTNIEELFPEILDNKQKYMNKQGEDIEYQFPNEDDSENPQTIQLNMIIQPIHFPDNGIMDQGFIFKIEQITDTLLNLNKKAGDIADQQREFQKSTVTYQFAFYPQNTMIKGSYIEQSYNPQDSTFIDHSIIIEGDDITQRDDGILGDLNNQDNNENKEENGETESQKALKNRIDWGKGFKTVRWFENRYNEVEDFGTDSDEDEEDRGRSIFAGNGMEEEADEGSLNDFSNSIKSRKALNTVVNDSTQIGAISNLKRVATVLIFSLIVLAFTDFFVASLNLIDNTDRVDLIIQSNKRIGTLQSILSNVRDLKLQQMGLYDEMYTPQESATYVENWKEQISTEILLLQELQKNLTFSSVELKPEHDQLITDNSIIVRFNWQHTEEQNLNDATQQIMNYAHQIVQLDLQDIKNDDPNVFFVEFNMFSDYYMALRQASDLYVQLLEESTQSSGSLYQSIPILAGISLLISMGLLAPLLIMVQRNKEDVLSLFLDIPEKTVKYLSHRCENFIANLQQGEDEEVESFDAINKQDVKDDMDAMFNQKRRRKKFKNTTMNQKHFIISFIAGTILIQTYFVFNYFTTSQILGKLNQLVPELNTTTLAEPFYYFVDNAQRQILFNYTFKPFDRDAQEVTKQNIQSLFDLDSQIHKEHSLNQEIGLDLYKEAFTSIMMDSPCEILFEQKATNVGDCEQFAEGAVSQGMAVLLTRYFENIRYINTIYLKFLDDPDLNFEETAPRDTFLSPLFPDDKFRQKILSLLVSPPMIENREIQLKYNYYSIKYLVAQFEQSIKDMIEQSTTQRLALLIVFIVLLIVVFSMFWLPYVGRMAKNIQKTRLMLKMIPLNVISDIKSIKVYIRKYVNDHSATK